MGKNNNFKRKHFFINKELQGRYMVALLIPMMILLLFMIFTLYFTAQAIVNTTTSTIKNEVQNNITYHLQDKSNPSKEDYKNMIDGILGYVRNFDSNEDFRNSLLSSLLLVFGIGILVVIFQIVMLTIYFSHRLAGPIYRFERVCHGVLEGDYHQKIVLREKDELKNLARLFNEVLTKTSSHFRVLIPLEDSEERRKLIEDLKID